MSESAFSVTSMSNQLYWAADFIAALEEAGMSADDFQKVIESPEVAAAIRDVCQVSNYPGWKPGNIRFLIRDIFSDNPLDELTFDTVVEEVELRGGELWLIEEIQGRCRFYLMLQYANRQVGLEEIAMKLAVKKTDVRAIREEALSRCRNRLSREQII